MTQTTMPANVARSRLGILLLLDAAGLAWATLAIFRVSSGSERAALFGLSAQSLLLVGLTLLFALGLFAAGLFTLREKLAAEKFITALLRFPAWSIALLAGLTLACWLLAWTPAERFADYYYYALRLIPLFGWLSFACGTGALFLFVMQRGSDAENGKAYLRQNRAIFFVSAIIIVVIGLTAWLAANRVVEMSAEEEDFWYGAGVPVLAWQVLTAGLLGLGVAWGERQWLHNGTKKSAGKLPVDAIAFVFIWVAAGVLWAQEPVASNFTITPPYPPNFEYYPAADSENYDIASQYALIGQGLFNGGKMRVYFERPFYSAFLFYLHLLAGQNFTLLLAFQAAIFAVFPAIVYLLGKTLHSRGTGAALALLLTLRGMTGLETGSLFDNSTQKMLLSDFPAAIGLALVILLAVRWAQDPQRNWKLAGWMGGAIGLWGFVRPHIAFLLPIGLLLAGARYFYKKRVGAAVAGFMLAAYLAATMPWIQFNGSGMSMVSLYLWRVQAIISERFHGTLPQPGGDSPAPHQITSTETAEDFSEPSQKPLTEFAVDHLLNNLTQASLALPTTLANLDAATIVKKTETFWKPYWDGALSPSAWILTSLNLALIALGSGLAWKRARLIGLFPLFGMLIYFAINSLARTSGGRYLVPADWVLLLYYMLGWAALFEILAAWFGNKIPAPPAGAPPAPVNISRRVIQGLGLLALLGGIGSAIPMTGALRDQRYEPLDKFQSAALLDDKALKLLGITPAEMQAFLGQDQSVVLQGRALYPRYIWRGINPLIPGHLLESKSFSRMSLILIGAHGHVPVILPAGDEWYAFPHASDVILLGCRQGQLIDAWAVILTKTDTAYMRLLRPPLNCPLPEPICDNNGSCR